VLATQIEWDEDVNDTSPAGGAAQPDRDPMGDTELYRLYQVPGAPHIGSRDSMATDPLLCTHMPLNQFADAALMYMPIEFMYDYLANGELPPKADRVEFDAMGYVRDEYGNAVGGVRSPQVDVPTVTFVTPNEGGGQCRLAGYEVPLSAEQLAELYPNGAADYEARLRARADELMQAGWFPDEYAYVIDELVAEYGQPVTLDYRRPVEEVPIPPPPAPAGGGGG